MRKHSEGNSSRADTGLHTSTHLVMSLAEERRDERQTFELEARRVRNRRQVRSRVPLHEASRQSEEETTCRRKKIKSGIRNHFGFEGVSAEGCWPIRDFRKPPHQFHTYRLFSHNVKYLMCKVSQNKTSPR